MEVIGVRAWVTSVGSARSLGGSLRQALQCRPGLPRQPGVRAALDQRLQQLPRLRAADVLQPRDDAQQPQPVGVGRATHLRSLSAGSARLKWSKKTDGVTRCGSLATGTESGRPRRRPRM